MTKKINITLAALALSYIGIGLYMSSPTNTQGAIRPSIPVTKIKDGLVFNCSTNKLKTELISYLNELDIKSEWYTVTQTENTLTLTLNTPDTDTNTLNLYERPEYGIQDEIIVLPAGKNKTKSVSTVSKKEIVLALMQHGRTTKLNGCTIDILKDHIGTRQMTAAWSEELNWIWPNGGYAQWNEQYWIKGTPVKNKPLHRAVADMFINQNWYSIGCYTATKMVMLQGVVDYYYRIKKDHTAYKNIEKILMSDGEPLVGIEPAIMWSFESDFDHSTKDNPGKILDIQYNIAKNNFIPGDWTYIYNTDKNSNEKIGYEGSNAIYLGRNKFDDYYNDNENRFHYTYNEKIDEVYQWRNGVFSRSRDGHKIKKLSETDLESLKQTPEDGGIQMSLRVYPKLTLTTY